MKQKRFGFVSVVLLFVLALGNVASAQDVDVPGNLLMKNSTPTEGNIQKGGVPFIHNFGVANTFIGSNAGNLTMSGGGNTAIGTDGLQSNTTGFRNTAIGFEALRSNTTGFENTAIGGALQDNAEGIRNTAVGSVALANNTTGSGNTASGVCALCSNTTGNNNTAIGFVALQNNTTGNFNIAIGLGAGINLQTGSNNIHIGNPAPGDESDTIRIGDGTHTRFFAAGVYDTAISDRQVFVDSNGQLGTMASSRRFKEEVRDMGEASNGLMRLRPVIFYYKREQPGPPRLLQYGLIAEEVAAVYPELVEYSETGEPFALRYHLLGPMLLNEVQRQDRQIQEQRQQIHEQAAQIAGLKGQAAENADLKADNVDLKARMEALERLVKGTQTAWSGPEE